MKRVLAMRCTAVELTGADGKGQTARFQEDPSEKGGVSVLLLQCPDSVEGYTVGERYTVEVQL